MPDPQQLNIAQEIADIDIGSELASLPPAPQSQPPAKQPEQPLGIGQWAARAIGGAFMGPAGVEAADHPGMTLASAAVGPVLKGVGYAVPRMLGISGARAGQNIQAATEAARNVPVNVEGVGQAGLRAMDMQAAGARMPRAASQLMRRITDPELQPITFGEARDFYSNLSRLSANEYGSLNPQMVRQMGGMRQALHQALTEGADTVGKGGQYAKGISEYARAAKAAQAGKTAAKYGVGLAGGGLAANYALDKILEALSRTSGSR